MAEQRIILRMIKGMMHAVALANVVSDGEKIICLDDDSYNFFKSINLQNEITREEEFINPYHSKMYYVLRESINNPGVEIVFMDAYIQILKKFLFDKLQYDKDKHGVHCPTYYDVFKDTITEEKATMPLAKIMIANECTQEMLDTYVSLASQKRPFRNDIYHYYNDQCKGYGLEEQVMDTVDFVHTNPEYWEFNNLKLFKNVLVGHISLFDNMVANNENLHLNYYDVLKEYYSEEEAYKYSMKDIADTNKKLIDYCIKENRMTKEEKNQAVAWHPQTLVQDIDPSHLYNILNQPRLPSMKFKQPRIFLRVVKGMVHAVALANFASKKDYIICLDDDSYDFLSSIGFENAERVDEYVNVYHSKVYYLIKASVNNPGVEIFYMDAMINIGSAQFFNLTKHDNSNGITCPSYYQVYSGSGHRPIAKIMIANNCTQDMLNDYEAKSSQAREYYNKKEQYYVDNCNSFGTEEQILIESWYCHCGDVSWVKFLRCFDRVKLSHYTLFDNILEDNKILNLNYYDYIKDYPKDEALKCSSSRNKNI